MLWTTLITAILLLLVAVIVLGVLLYASWAERASLVSLLSREQSLPTRKSILADSEIRRAALMWPERLMLCWDEPLPGNSGDDHPRTYNVRSFATVEACIAHRRGEILAIARIYSDDRRKHAHWQLSDDTLLHDFLTEHDACLAIERTDRIEKG